MIVAIRCGHRRGAKDSLNLMSEVRVSAWWDVRGKLWDGCRMPASCHIEEADAGTLKLDRIKLRPLKTVASRQKLAAVKPVEDREILTKGLLDPAHRLNGKTDAVLRRTAPLITAVIEHAGGK